MIKERYRDNVGWLHSQKLNTTESTTPQWETEGKVFRYNTVTKRGSIFNEQTGVYQPQAVNVYLTDSQLDFKQGDRVTDSKIPLNDANAQDFGLISSIIQTEIRPNGNRYRTRKILSSELTIQ